MILTSRTDPRAEHSSVTNYDSRHRFPHQMSLRVNAEIRFYHLLNYYILTEIILSHQLLLHWWYAKEKKSVSRRDVSRAFLRSEMSPCPPKKGGNNTFMTPGAIGRSGRLTVTPHYALHAPSLYATGAESVAGSRIPCEHIGVCRWLIDFIPACAREMTRGITELYKLQTSRLIPREGIQ